MPGGSISAWNRTQIEFEHGFWQDPEAYVSSLTTKAVMLLGKDPDFRDVEGSEGKLTLNASGLHYEDPYEKIDVPLHLLPGLSADYGNGFIVFYRGDEVRRFYLEDRRMAARFINSLMVLKHCK